MKDQNYGIDLQTPEESNNSPIASCLKSNHDDPFHDGEIELANLDFTNQSLEDAEHMDDMDQFNPMKAYDEALFSKRETNKRYMEVVMRGCSAIILLIALWWFRRGSKTSVYSDGFCLKDQGHIWTESINELCHRSKAWLSFFEITSSGIMDVVFVNMMIYWFLYGKSGQMLWNVAIFYGTRGIV